MKRKELLRLGAVAVGTLLLLKPTLNGIDAFLSKLTPPDEYPHIGPVPKIGDRIPVARYQFAKRYCSGKVVADIAAGNGYGTRILREVAARVDPYDKEPIGDNIVIDLEKQKWGKRYDVIVSLETIEHLANPEFFLANARDTADLVVLSTQVNEDPSFNKFHKQWWKTAELKSLLERFFACEYHTQKEEEFPLEDNPETQFVAVCRPH